MVTALRYRIEAERYPRGPDEAMDIERFFSASELAAVEAAIHQAEGASRAEIVTVATPASDRYDGAPWRGAALGAVSTAVAAGVTSWFGGAWGGALWLTASLPTILGALAGYVAADRIPWLRRQLVAPQTMDRRVRRRAAAAFLEHEVFATQDRSGVLLFLSLFEHRAVVLGDSGINAHVRPEEWQAIIAELCRRMHAGDVAGGLVEAVAACGRLLERSGLEARTDDRDELPNRLRLEHGPDHPHR